MMNVKKILLTGTGVLLALTLAGPAAAAPRDKGASPPDRRPAVGALGSQAPTTEVAGAHEPGPPASVVEAKAERLQQRMEHILRARKQNFDRAEARISDRMTKVQALADRLEAKGGDVAAAEAALTQAQAGLDAAAAKEAQAADLFRAIPGADDKRAAFKDARDMAKDALEELRAARAEVREAVKLLRREIIHLRRELVPGEASPGGAADPQDQS